MMNLFKSHFRRTTTASLFVVIVMLASSLPAAVNSASQEKKRAQVMVLGVYHMDNPNQDYVKTNVDDHLSEKRQGQILEVSELLAKFKPTRIVLEAVEGVSPVHRNYDAYLKGEYALKADERDQLGLRLAKQLGHKRVYAVDHRIGMDFESVVQAAQQSGNRVFLEAFQGVMAEIQEFEKRKARMTVREILAEMNDPTHIAKARDLYLQIARVRSGDKFVGADVLTNWYQRNFRIFSLLAPVIESPEERVLVIFGAGHAPILRELVQSSPDLQLVEPNDYLSKR
ncbi:MAG TPA: DUF5694 domain-containing protein [Blastocatellia bacterium]|nr:DUF5694 domain-containing protein [Blastocatellia bacterium]